MSNRPHDTTIGEKGKKRIALQKGIGESLPIQHCSDPSINSFDLQHQLYGLHSFQCILREPVNLKTIWFTFYGHNKKLKWYINNTRRSYWSDQLIEILVKVLNSCNIANKISYLWPCLAWQEAEAAIQH